MELENILSGEQSTTEVAAPEQTATAQTQQPDQGATAEAEQSTGEQTGAPPEPQKDDPLEKHSKGLEAAAAAERKRRQEAETKRQEAEARAQALQQELEALRRPQQPQKQQDEGKPLRSQFETEDEWLDARDAWRDQQRERQSAETRRAEAERKLYETTEAIYAQAQALEGFDRARFDALPLTEPIVKALVDSDDAPALMHFMAANPAEVTRIAGLSDARQIKEMARIEDRLKARKDEGQQPDPKAKPQLPITLTQARDARGRFDKPGYDGPTPLNAILK